MKSYDSNTYTYNANGIRTSKTVGGVKHEYTLDGTKILRETWGSNTLVPLYDNEDSVCGILYNNVTYYFIKNLQGDVIAIVDKDAETVARYSYDAWGAVTSEVTYTDLTKGVDIATINPFRYRGYYYDVEIDLYYLQSRYYDASVGRFVNEDDTDCLSYFVNNTTSENLYTMCGNNPIMGIDSNGYWNGWWNSVKTVGIALDVIFIAITGGISIVGIQSIKKFLKNNSRKIVKNISKQLLKMVGSAVVSALSSILDIAFTLFGTSLGDLIARAIDWCDPWWGKRRNNGYVFG